jgi:hypothetical protein
MNDPDAIAAQRHQTLVSLSDDPDAWRRAPFSDLHAACLSAKYGDDEPLDPMTCKF